jgi:hypothetical protein
MQPGGDIDLGILGEHSNDLKTLFVLQDSVSSIWIGSCNEIAVQESGQHSILSGERRLLPVTGEFSVLPLGVGCGKSSDAQTEIPTSSLVPRRLL